MKVLSVTLKRKKLGKYENLIGRLKVETDRGTFYFQYNGKLCTQNQRRHL